MLLQWQREVKRGSRRWRPLSSYARNGRGRWRSERERKRKGDEPDEALLLKLLQPLPCLLQRNSSLLSGLRSVDEVEVKVIRLVELELTLDLLFNLPQTRVNLRDDVLLLAKDTRRLESGADGPLIAVVLRRVEVGESGLSGGDDRFDDEGSDTVGTDGTRVGAPGGTCIGK